MVNLTKAKAVVALGVTLLCAQGTQAAPGTRGGHSGRSVRRFGGRRAAFSKHPHPAHAEECERPPAPGESQIELDLPVGTVQTMRVQSYSLYSENWVATKSGEAVSRTRNHIHLTGQPTEGSAGNLKQARVFFVDPPGPPHFAKGDKNRSAEIILYLSKDQYPFVLRQLEAGLVHCQISHLEQGEFYGMLKTQASIRKISGSSR